MNPINDGSLAKTLVEQILKTHGIGIWYEEPNKLEEIKALKKQHSDTVKQYVLSFALFFQDLASKDSANRTYKAGLASSILVALLRKNLNYSEAEWITLFDHIHDMSVALQDKKSHKSYITFPINYAIRQLEHFLKKNPLSDKVLHYIQSMLNSWHMFDGSENHYWLSDVDKAQVKLKQIINDSGHAIQFELKTEDIGTVVMALLEDGGSKQAFHAIFSLAAAVSGSKPTKKFTAAVQSELEQADKENYRKLAHQVVQVAIDQPMSEEQHEHHYNNKVWYYTTTTYLCDPSKQFIKGVVWTLDGFSDKTTISLLEKLLHKSYAKIPGEGPAAAAVGNACIYVLGNMRGKDGLGALSRARLKLKQNNVKKMIQKQLDAGAEKYGVSVAELEEMAVPDFGLVS